jgi:PRTRC genetic system protein A
MNSLLVGYLVARDGVPTRSGRAYDHVMAGGGLYLCTANEWLELRVPVARCRIRGLAPVYSACNLLCNRIHGTIWETVLNCLQLAYFAGVELLAGVRHDGNQYQLVLPQQTVAPWQVHYEPRDDLVLEIHSHRDGAAQFSVTDTADEQRLRIYGVVGGLDRARPEVALRAGAYGYFIPVAWTSVFDGDPTRVVDVLDLENSEFVDDLRLEPREFGL